MIPPPSVTAIAERPVVCRLVLVASLAIGARAVHADSELNTDYLTAIKPVLHERCFACHGALKQESDLRLDTVAAMRVHEILGNDGELLARITSTDDDLRMPPEGEPLKAHEIAAIRRWIARGSPGPADEKPEADPKSHWAFQRIERPAGFSPGRSSRSPRRPPRS